MCQVESTLREIQDQAGLDRHQDMLRVDELLHQILQEYSTEEEVAQHRGQKTGNHVDTSSDLTFF